MRPRKRFYTSWFLDLLLACRSVVQSRSPVAVPPLPLGEVAPYVPSSEEDVSQGSESGDDTSGSEDVPEFQQEGWEDDGDGQSGEGFSDGQSR